MRLLNIKFITICLILASALNFFILTLGSFDVNKKYYLSTVFFEVWKNITSLDLTIDPDIIGGEGFLINGKTTVYFLPFPALIRGFLSIFGFGSSSVISVFIATITFLIGSVFIAINLFNQGNFKKQSIKNEFFYIVIVFITICSPISSFLAFPSVFWEAIIWGSTLFLISALFSFILCKEKSVKSQSFFFFAIFCGLTLFTRANFSFAACILFGLTVLQIIARDWNGKYTLFFNLFKNKNLVWSCLIFTVFLVGLLIFNYLKWGNPFEFYPLKYYLIFNEEQKKIFLSHGSMNINRIPEGISYYFLPAKDNFISSLPFIQFGGSNYFSGLGEFDYTEPTLPVTITLPIYTFLFVAGIFVFFKSFLTTRQAISRYLFPAGIAALIPIIFILTLHSHSIRYIGDFMPAVVIFSLYALFYIGQIIANLELLNIFKKLKAKFILRSCFYFIIVITFTVTIFLSTVAVLLENKGWRFLMVDHVLAPLTMNQPVSFIFRGNSGEISKYLKSGWAMDVENWGTWSNSSNARLELVPPIGVTKSNNLILETRVFVTPKHPDQKIEIWVNGVLNQTLILTKPTNTIIINLNKGTNFDKIVQRVVSCFERSTGLRFFQDSIIIDFKFLNPISPKDIGEGGDDRKLSLGLISATVR